MCSVECFDARNRRLVVVTVNLVSVKSLGIGENLVSSHSGHFHLVLIAVQSFLENWWNGPESHKKTQSTKKHKVRLINWSIGRSLSSTKRALSALGSNDTIGSNQSHIFSSICIRLQRCIATIASVDQLLTTIENNC